jgi:NADH:ubiquinone oxidoreductase subunit F (NADH-binding)
VSSFFPHFRRQPPAEVEVQVCRDIACQLRGACELRQQLQSMAGGDDPARLKVEGVSCLGRCDRAPVVRVNRGPEVRNYVQRKPDEICDIVRRTLDGGPPPHDSDAALPLQAWEPWKIDVYAGPGSSELKPYSAIRRFVVFEERGRIIRALETAGLLGMGGAGGRTYKKWADVRQAAGDVKYVVCNGDESEPGTFKDRELLLRTPHLVLEGVILAGLLLNAKHGYIYIRHEYEEQIEIMRREIARAEQMRVCGKDILGSGVDFPVDVFVSPGGYICGEQTALIEAMEDKRAEPRNRPPELQTNGLFDKPTLLNNVETLAWVPAIVLQDEGHWFADQGQGKFRGLRFFSVSGDLANPGVYEVPIGITLRELIEDHAGGMRDGQQVKALALSGPSGGFLPRLMPVSGLSRRWVADNLPKEATHFDLLDLVLDINVSRKMGVMLAGGVIVYGDQADMVEAAASASEFFRNESCGKCVPCRIGSQKLVELMTDLLRRRFDEAELLDAEDGAQAPIGALVKELSETMKLTAICGLGTVASNPMSYLLAHFPDDVRRYVGNHQDGKRRQSVE